MLRQVYSTTRPGWRSPTRILLPVGLVTLVAIVLAAFSLFWAVRQSNDVSVERQIRTTERSIQAVVSELAQQQEMVAVWDDAVEKLREPQLDFDWLDANMGIWLHRTFGQDQVYILNERNEPVDAMIGGERVPVSEFGLIRPSLNSFIRDIRQTADEHGGHGHERAGSSYLTTGKAVHDAHVIQLLGRPAAVSVMKIVRESDDIPQEPGTEPLLVSVRFLDDTFPKQLAERNLIEGLHFSSSNLPRPGEVSVPLKSDYGDTIGYFIWKPELPGSKILKVIGPSTALVCALMIVVMGWLVRSLRSSMARLESTVVELRASEAHAQHLAFHDVLTGLPNRALFDDRLDRALSRSAGGEKSALLMLDLDRFKNVNDTLGHQAGDNLIRELAGRLSGLVRTHDTVARLGGDEFAILLFDIGGRTDVEVLCSRIFDAVHQPFDLLGSQAFVGVSIGIVMMPDEGVDRIDLLRKADIALYHAKNDGRGCHRYFELCMDEDVKRRATIEEELREALETGDSLKVHYQPQVAAAGRPVIGLEALIRWQHPTRGLIAPDQFLPIAEDTGLIVPLGDMVLRHVCATSKRWPNLFIAINLSPAQFRSNGLAERIVKIVRECGADPRKIELEVTENVLLGDKLTRDALRKLRSSGFRIALDDFGSGHSSLSYLRRYEVDKIKIDRSFVQHLGHTADADSAAIIKAITTLGQTIGLTVTAEGVETEDQRRFLETTGCMELQGHLFAKALPEDRIAGLMASDMRARPSART
ncbi:putative bifunctional diguanylate cyclase/phosphodiesterase [Microvirga sp. GCM10011540]|uniref:putative bifunctional diguanylate cyclase/phosphodiesterase n=1 Tax=Microvirga sp. GCM10011540 TaxID=3317338 RepID=UPI00361C3E1A